MLTKQDAAKLKEAITAEVEREQKGISADGVFAIIDSLAVERELLPIETLAEDQRDLTPEINEAVNEHFWELVGDEKREPVETDAIEACIFYAKNYAENRPFQYQSSHLDKVEKARGQLGALEKESGMIQHIFVIADDQSQWEEDYILENNIDPVEWAKQTLDIFNSSLRPHELPRHYISHRSNILPGDKEHHTWEKRLDGMSVDFRGQIVDLFYCSKCGITGKRFGLSSTIKRDSKYRAKKYVECEGALKGRVG